MPRQIPIRPRYILHYGKNLLRFARTLWQSGFLVPHHLYDFDRWMRTGFPAPPSTAVKWKVLERFGLGQVWIESGTHLGETAKFLSTISTHTYSIEPEPTLAKKAISLFGNNPKVTVIQGTSEDVLPSLLDSICDGSKPDISFWLDGHYSKDLSAFKGPSDTPIRQELDTIASHLGAIGDVAILIDDMRCFDPQTVEFASYPKKSYLVEWAEAHNLFWTIEHDIFIATSRPTLPFLFRFR